MTHATHRRLVIGAALVFIFSSPFLAPKSCEGGLDVYFWIGIISIVALAVVPYVMREHSTSRQRLLQAVGGVVATLAVWIAVFALAPFRIMCRLI